MAGYNRLEYALWEMCSALKAHIEKTQVRGIDFVKMRVELYDDKGVRHGVAISLTGEPVVDDFIELAKLVDPPTQRSGDLTLSEDKESSEMKPSETMFRLDRAIDDAEYGRRRP